MSTSPAAGLPSPDGAEPSEEDVFERAADLLWVFTTVAENPVPLEAASLLTFAQFELCDGGRRPSRLARDLGARDEIEERELAYPTPPRAGLAELAGCVRTLIHRSGGLERTLQLGRALDWIEQATSATGATVVPSPLDASR